MKSEHWREVLRSAQDFGSGLGRPLNAESWPGGIVLPDGLKGEKKDSTAHLPHQAVLSRLNKFGSWAK